MYNHALASLAKVDHRFAHKGVHSFRINIVPHHHMGSIIPPEGLDSQCAQVYVLDPAQQLASPQRLPFATGLNAEIL